MAKNRFSKAQDRFAFVKTWGMSFIFFGAIAIMCWQGLGNMDQSTEQEKLEAARKAVVQAAVHCYALEGEYPPNPKYLQEHYGLHLEKDYVYHYEGFASNIMPDITVVPKNGPINLDAAKEEGQ